MWAGQTKLQVRTYFDTLQNIFGCDSIVSSNLSVFPAFSDTVSVSIQEGEQVAGVTVFGDTVILIELNTVNGCDSIIVNLVEVIQTNAFFPTAFSPNGDGSNDIFHVLSNNVTEIRLMIFNRWGEKIFETNSLNIGWDGTFKDEPCEIGVYVYYAEITFQGSTEPKNYKGSITLIR